MENIDSAQLNFSQSSLWILNICLGIIMFGVALGLKVSDFKAIAAEPKPALVGIFSQFVALPFLTFVLIFLLQPQPSIALGMIVVAACPGGNISNFISQISGGNSALSVTLTAFSTLMAIIFTPLNIQFWGSLYPPTHTLLHEVSVDPIEVLKTIILLLGIPLILGMLVRAWKPKTALFLGKILRPLSLTIFVAFVGMAFYNNMDLFIKYFQIVVLIVFLHNATALGCGYFLGMATGLNVRDRRTLAIETGIQNSGLGLLLIFSFFNGSGGMAIIAGWWGIWHIISGLSMAYIWNHRKILSVT